MKSFRIELDNLKSPSGIAETVNFPRDVKQGKSLRYVYAIIFPAK